MTTQTLLALVFAAAVAAAPAAAAPQQQPAGKPAPPPQPPLEKPMQPAAAQPAAAQPTPPQPAAGQPPPASAGYSYKPGDRRDPFVSLLGRSSDPRATGNRPTGLAGFLINEVIVTGIVEGEGGFVATLRGPDNKSYIVRSGARLMDGTVKSISARQVVFSQDVNDPLSLIKQREIPKSVRPGGESIQ